jgi:transposase
LEDITEALGMSGRSCYHWRRIFEEFGTVVRPPSPLTGRTQTITRTLLTAIEDIFTVDSDLFLDEVCTWLAAEHDITVSKSTLSHNLNEAGLTCKIFRKLASKHDKARREEFRASLRNDFIGDGSEFIVIDETSKNDRTYARHYGQAPRGHRTQLIDVFVRGDQLVNIFLDIF